MSRHGHQEVDARVVPLETAQSKLKACMSCSLIKTANQFYENGCENCPFIHYQHDKDKVGQCTTSNFVGYVRPSGRGSVQHNLTGCLAICHTNRSANIEHACGAGRTW